MSGQVDDLLSYRRAMAALTPHNPRQETDILASLRAFDALNAAVPPRAAEARGPGRFGVAAGSAVAGWWAWLRRPGVLGLGGVVAASVALAVMFGPQFGPPDGTAPAGRPAPPPELRLALPREPEPETPDQRSTAAPEIGSDAQTDRRPNAGANGETDPGLDASFSRDVRVLAAFSAETPQYFSLPWSRSHVLALLAGSALSEPGVEPVFRDQDRGLALMPRPTGLAGGRSADEGYHRFAVSLFGLALLRAGQDLGADWTEARLLSEANQAAVGHPQRLGALEAVLAAP